MTSLIWETKKVRIESAGVQWDGTDRCFSEISDFVPAEYLLRLNKPYMQVYNTLEDQWLNVPIGHWVVKGLKGEFYPCEPGVMEMKYEQVFDDELTIDVLIKGASGLPDGYDDPRIDNVCGVLKSVLRLAQTNDAVPLTQIEKIVAESTEFAEMWSDDFNV